MNIVEVSNENKFKAYIYDNRYKIGENLLSFIKDNGYTKSSISKLTGISRPTFDKLIKGDIDNNTTLKSHIDKIVMTFNITSSNLNDVIKENRMIKSEIDNLKNNFFVNFNKIGIVDPDKLVFEVLKKNYNLIQLPIDDKYWGGAIFIRNNLKIPVINSAQPRVYQYFVAWHELFHLLYDTSIVHSLIVKYKLVKQ